ncbi:transmembrane epididymal protein 1A-like [Protopterus annectens]|uniref:transmembrane epididymal protein 1A-like n=1 Tax=Protopterus annectens TaxID=7888 RepID=UPI001CFBC093|nr:transmembrane epididymal protein 1A-like [Protopterus annectens]
MGTFIGHISPGLAFFSFGILYAFRYSWAVVTGAVTMPQNYSLAQKVGTQGLLKRLPLEGIMKVIYGTLAASAEFFYPPGTNKLQIYDRSSHDLHFMHPNEWQHFTMYCYFAISGWVDIISQTCLPRRQIILENVAITVAFYIEALLLFFHRHGKGVVEITVHELLLLTCCFICVILTVEIWHSGDRVLCFAKTCLVQIQGTWLFHAAFILYKPATGKPWKDDDMSNVMFVTTFYGWHIVLNAVLLAAIYGLVVVLHTIKPPQTWMKLKGHSEVCHMGFKGLPKSLQKMEYARINTAETEALANEDEEL